MNKCITRQIAESDDMFDKKRRDSEHLYLSSDIDMIAIFEERLNVIIDRNKGVIPEYDKNYYCGTCGKKDGAEHPITGYCFYCDTDNWISKDE